MTLERKRITVHHPKTACAHIKHYKWDVVSFDTETRGLSFEDRWIHGGSYGRHKSHHPTGISFDNGEVSLYIDTCGWSDAYIKKVMKALKEYWVPNNGRGRTIIAHNLPFDYAALRKYGIGLAGAKLRDTLTASHLLDNRRCKDGRGNGLKALASEFLGVEEALPWEDAKVRKDVFIRYAHNDAIWTYELYKQFEPRIKEEGMWPLYDKVESPFQIVLTEMEVNGVLLDLERVKEQTQKLYDEMTTLEVDMCEEAGIPYTLKKTERQVTLGSEPDDNPIPKMTVSCDMNWNSGQQVSDLLSKELGVPLVTTTPSGAWYSTSEEDLAPFVEDFPIIDKLIQYKKMQKLLTGFFVKLPEQVSSDGRVRPNWRNAGTRTGRLSCSNPNMQQTPKPSNDSFGVRKCYVAPEGKLLLACDYSGQENSVLAHVSQDYKLISLINNRQDVHLGVANQFMDLGISDEQLYKDHPDFEHLKEVKFKEERGKAKTITFGLAYGKSGYGFAKDFGVSEEEGEKIVEDYKKRFPGVAKAMSDCDKQVDKYGEVTHLFGRKRKFSKIENNGWTGYAKGDYRAAFNFLIQGPSADMIRLAAVRTLLLQSKYPEWDLRVVATVHDENVYEVREEFVDEAAKKIKETFESLSELFSVPFEADVSYGKSYAECK